MNNFYKKIKNDLDNLSENNNYEKIEEEISQLKFEIDSLREQVKILIQIEDI